MPADNDQLQKRAGLKRQLSQAFNSVAGKVVRVDELVDNFDNLAGNNLGFFERGVVSGKMRDMANNLPNAQGVYTGGGSNFVSTEFLKDKMIKAIDEGKLDGREDVAQRAGVTTVQAIQRSTDNSAAVKSGQIKPKTP